MSRTGLTGGVDWSNRSELSWCSCPVFVKWLACIRLGGVALVQGELACVQGELFVVFELWFGGLCSLLKHSFVSAVSSRCPCIGGLRLVFVKWSFSLPFLTFDRLLEFLFYSFLLLFFSLNLLCVCCQCTHQGGLLPSVKRDWQRCVDWFLAKYCRCRLRLDWCWCKWRRSVKGRCWWVLQVWRREVRLVRGTRWPAGSSAGHMAARTARWSHGWFLGCASKLRSSWDYVGAESWVAIGGGYTKFAGFLVVHQKTSRFLGWSTKPRPKNQRRRCSSIGRTDRWVPVWLVRSTGLTGVQRRSPETLKLRTHIGIARLASRPVKFAVAGHPSDGAIQRFPNSPLRGMYP
jgi:hypothetical protein